MAGAPAAGARRRLSLGPRRGSARRPACPGRCCCRCPIPGRLRWPRQPPPLWPVPSGPVPGALPLALLLPRDVPGPPGARCFAPGPFFARVLYSLLTCIHVATPLCLSLPSQSKRLHPSVVLPCPPHLKQGYCKLSSLLAHFRATFQFSRPQKRAPPTTHFSLTALIYQDVTG